MGWTEEFQRELRGDVALVFLLESVAVGRFTGGRELQLSSHYVVGYDEAIDPQRSSVTHGELQVPSWTRTATSVTLSLTQDVRRRTTPGQVVRLRLGLSGWPASAFETVFVGVVRALRWAGGSWSLQLVDLAYSLQSRWVGPTDDPRLFSSLDGVSAEVNGLYLPTDTTVSVDSTAGWEKSDVDPYCLLVVPESGAPPFYLTATGKTGTSFTGVSSAGQFGTTAVNANVGSGVVPVALAETHPLNAVRRILVSTGTLNYHGERDVNPASWGYALPTELVDGEDIRQQVLRSSPASGSNNWALLVSEPQDDGQSLINQFLAPGGFFLSQRQGQLTARAAMEPGYSEPPDTWSLQDGHVEAYDTWDSAIPVEARTMSITFGASGTWGTSATEQVDTRPARERHELELPAVFDNTTAWGSSVDDRLRPYLLRRGERLVVRSAGFRLAPAAIGDCLRLTTDQVESRYSAEGWAFRDRRTLVVGGGPDWFRGVTRLTLLSHVPGPLSTL